jgi:hypothetical protein
MTGPPKKGVQGIAVAWLRKEDWSRWLSIDPDFQPDYDHWLRRTEGLMKDPRYASYTLEKVEIDPDTFLEWSKANGGKVDSNARATFAAFILAQRHSRRKAH